MGEIASGNWSLKDPGDDIPSGSVVSNGNFSQLLPDTAILVGKALTINGGNWTNVRQDPAWTINGGNWTQVEYCAHLHPEWNLAVEADNCSHVIETDVVTIDGVVVDTIYHREDTIQ